jgi:hypothetical protein
VGKNNDAFLVTLLHNEKPLLLSISYPFWAKRSRARKRAAYCCDYIATPRKSPIFCDPEAQFGPSSRDGTRETKIYLLRKDLL